MAFEYEQRQALSILDGIVEGTMRASNSAALIDDADPALIHLIFNWIRDRYRADHPAAEGVLGRLGELCNNHSSVPRKAREGASDPVVEWFEDTYSYRELSKDQFIALVVDKLES